MLIIRDGWGINPGGREHATENGDATLLARTPFHDQLYAKYPMAKVSASGEDVGLPEGQMGNSEVGHLNLGAGRIVYQDLTRINKALAAGELARNKIAQEAFAKARGHRLHLLGLVSQEACIAIIVISWRWPKRRMLREQKRFLFMCLRTEGMRRRPVERHLAGMREGTGEKRRANRHSRRPLFCDGS